MKVFYKLLAENLYVYTLFVVLLYSVILAPFAHATGTRVFNSPVRPYRKLAKQFASNANVFTIVNPDKDGTPLAVTSCTGRSGMDGTVTVSLQAGFTAPVTLTCFFWQQDNVTPANAGWTRLGPVASGGANNYTQAVDSHYASVAFAIPENTDFLIMSNAAITGNVYTDGLVSPNNANSAAGF